MRRRLTLLAGASLLSLSLVAGPVAARTSGPTIVDTAIAVNAQTGEFDHLIAAVVRTGLAGTLDGNRQFTVFAPTDAAFEELFGVLGVSSVDEIPFGTLRSVLLLHVAPGERLSGDVFDSTRIRTLAKAFVFPTVAGGTAYINDGAIVAADVDVSNGVIHVIDSVLLPS
jgi:transforming growth factor-beta-induced protein